VTHLPQGECVTRQAAGSIEGFRYPAPMRKRAATGLVWDNTNPRGYPSDPKSIIPAGSMSSAGFRDNQQNISDVIAYLRQVGGQ